MLWSPGGKGAYSVVTNAGIVGSQTPWTGVTSGTANNYGASPTELISAASNVRDSWGIGIAVTATGTNAVARQACVDIVVGGATDDTLISSLLCGYAIASGSSGGVWHWFFPVHIPAGLRIAARHSNNTATITAQVGVWLYGGGTPPFRVGRKVTTYGTKASNSRGVAVTPTASGGAASVTQIVASTSEDHFYFMPGFQAATDSTLTNSGFHSIGIGVGASTEERIGTWWINEETGEAMTGMVPALGAFSEQPSGTRLTILASGPQANDDAYDALIYAVS